ncbi:MAG: hypothetical protein Q9162_000703 [Coniocarpon cinnabarinum]
MPFGLPKFVELPKGHPDVLFSVPDRPGFHREPQREQRLSLPWRSRSQRRPLRALDVAATPSQRDRLYHTETRAPNALLQADRQVARLEQHSPTKREKRISLSLSSRSTPRTPRTPVIVEQRSPTVYAEDTFAGLPDFHPAQLPKPDPYPVFIHSQGLSSKQAKYESESEDLSTDSDDYAHSDGVQYEARRPPRQRRHRHHHQQAPPPPPPVPQAPEVVYEYKRIEETDWDRDTLPRRSRSHRSYRDHDRDDHVHVHRSHHRHHRHHRHRSSSRPRHVRSEPDRDADFLAPPAPEPPRARARRSAAPSPAVHREPTRSRSRSGARGMLEDPRDVRERELIAERQFFGESDGRKVKQTQYQYR